MKKFIKEVKRSNIDVSLSTNSNEGEIAFKKVGKVYFSGEEIHTLTAIARKHGFEFLKIEEKYDKEKNPENTIFFEDWNN